MRITGSIQCLISLPVPMGYLQEQFFFIMKAFKGHSQSTWWRLRFKVRVPKNKQLFPYLQINTSMPPVIRSPAITTRAVNGSRKNRTDKRMVKSILPLSITLTSDTFPNCNAR